MLSLDCVEERDLFEERVLILLFFDRPVMCVLLLTIF